MSDRIFLVALAAFSSIAAADEFLRPGSLQPADLEEYASLDGLRKRIVDEALDLAASSKTAEDSN